LIEGRPPDADPDADPAADPAAGRFVRFYPSGRPSFLPLCTAAGA
jgi:hypothetical protein